MHSFSSGKRPKLCQRNRTDTSPGEGLLSGILLSEAPCVYPSKKKVQVMKKKVQVMKKERQHTASLSLSLPKDSTTSPRINLAYGVAGLSIVLDSCQ